MRDELLGWTSGPRVDKRPAPRAYTYGFDWLKRANELVIKLGVDVKQMTAGFTTAALAFDELKRKYRQCR